MSRPPSQGWTRLLLGCGEVAGPLFTAVYLWQGALREGYRPRRHPVSSLALGERGAVQRASFAVAGSLFLAFAVGVRRSLPTGGRARMLPSLVAGAGAGLLGAGTFATDPISGYPLGTPALPDSPSLGGRFHNLCGVPVFVGMPVACLATALGSAGGAAKSWRIYSAASGLTMLGAMGLAGRGFAQDPALVDNAGLLQRISISAGMGWACLLARRLR